MLVCKAESILTTGFNSSYEKEQIVEELEAMKKELRTIPKSAAPEVVQQKVQLIHTLEGLGDEVTQSSNYRAKKDITSDFSKAEKKIIQAMLPELYCGHGNWSKLDSFIWRLFETSKDRDKFIEAITEEKAQSIIEEKDMNLDRMESVIAATKS